MSQYLVTPPDHTAADLRSLAVFQGEGGRERDLNTQQKCIAVIGTLPWGVAPRVPQLPLTIENINFARTYSMSFAGR